MHFKYATVGEFASLSGLPIDIVQTAADNDLLDAVTTDDGRELIRIDSLADSMLTRLEDEQAERHDAIEATEDADDGDDLDEDEADDGESANVSSEEEE